MRSRRNPLLLPLLLIVLGGVLLAQNFLLIDLDLRVIVPALIVLAGLQLLFRGDVGLSWAQQSFGITRGTVRTAQLEASAGELDVRLSALRREGRLIAGQYTGRSRPELNIRGNQARLSLQRGAAWPFSQADWEIGLARDLPWEVAINAHLGEVEADFRDLILDAAHLLTGFGDIYATLGGDVKHGVRLRSTFGDVAVAVPEGVEAVIRVLPGALSRVQAAEDRYVILEPGVYATRLYESAVNLIHVEAGTTFGTVRLR